MKEVTILKTINDGEYYDTVIVKYNNYYALKNTYLYKYKRYENTYDTIEVDGVIIVFDEPIELHKV